MQNKHYILYDATCPICKKAVAALQKKDKKKIFSFLPLEGEKSKELCKDHPEYLSMNTMILIENETREWIRAKAFFRTLWLLGGGYRLIGWLYILPPFLINPFYILFARIRHYF